jgi:hypothetical protein
MQAEQRKGIFALMAAVDGKHMFTQYIVQQFTHGTIIINDQNRGLHCAVSYVAKGLKAV